MIVIKEFNKLTDFCNYQDLEFGGTSENGIAYQHKKNKRIFCFKYVDLERGRGEAEECKKAQCNHYIFVNPNQTMIDEYYKEQMPKLEDISDPKKLMEL